MSAARRLLAFAVVLVVVFAAGYGIGAAVGPEPTADPEPVPSGTDGPMNHQDHEGGHA